MSELDMAVLFTGSGSVRENPHTLLLEKIRYLESSGEQALDLRRQGMDYGRIRNKIFGRESFLAYATLGHFSGRHLVRSFIEDRPTSP